MRQVREIVRLSLEAGLSTRVVGERVGVGPTTVRDTLKRFARAGLAWSVPEAISDAELEQLLYGVPGVKPGRRKVAEPDWSVVVRELKRKHVTLQVLWDEYIAEHPDGYRYSRFCDLFRNWEGRLPLVMRQHHGGGEKLFVDYAGDTVPVVDRRTGEVRDAHIFVAVMGASSLSFALATWTEQLGDWIAGHNAAHSFFGGATQLLGPDNAKVAVIKACLYDPMVNRSYGDMAQHYGTAIVPARPRRQRDKAKVEAGVGIVERGCWGGCATELFTAWPSSTVRSPSGWPSSMTNGCCVSMAAHGASCSRKLMRRILSRFLASRGSMPEWRRCRVGLDYHVEIERHYYSVPYRFAHREVEARTCARTVEIFLGGERIAAHMRGSGNGRHTTISAHMPSIHRRYGAWTPAKIRSEASRIGPMLRLLIDRIIEDRPHPEQGYCSCPGIIRLEKRFGAKRLEAAALRAIEIQARNYPSVKSILEKGLDRVATPASSEREPIIHTNIRGSDYYH
ncbi:transposase [Bradyrhizobium japonicum]